MPDVTLETLAALVQRVIEGQDRLRSDLMARMDRLQDALTAQHDADVVNYGAAERAERIAQSAREEVRALGEQVGAMVRQIQRLQSEVRQLRGEA